MRYLRIILLSLLCTAAASAQLSHTVRLEKNTAQHGTFSITGSAASMRAARVADTVRILAVMVNFAKDADSQTSGDGSFLKSDIGTIDPTPHDSAYFANKILFVKNYFKKVSNGKLNVTGDVIGPVNVPLGMSSYAPPTTGTDNSKLAQFVLASWQKTDSVLPSLDFSRYDLFVIFHAGTGRDLDMVSLLGYNPTPHDLPSLYFDSSAIASALPVLAPTGIAVRNGAFHITNSIVLPETESRIISATTGADTLQYSINGLFAACVGSYLGLPDLYNTRSGASGIGEFGLMDGAGFFAYNGLFPPEPSAWEKMFLGWLTPITISENAAITLPAVSLTTTGQDSVYKVSISSTEYFLLENRNRDPLGTGQKIFTVNKSGIRDSLTFLKDTAGFNYYEIGKISGSVIDVSNYDWALIGYMDSTKEYDGGGVLIWHIDESVIAANLASNTVNVDSSHRGVDLEEADGSQDIGQTYESLTSGSGTEYGSPQDCWYKENPLTGHTYTNLFGSSTYPNSNSYSGVSSLITIKNFSNRSSRMTADVRIGGDICSSYLPFIKTLTPALPGSPVTTDSSVALVDSGKIYLFRPNGTSKTSDTTGFFASKGGMNGICITEYGSAFTMIGAQDSVVYLFKAQMQSGGTLTGRTDAAILLNDRITTAPMVCANVSGKFIFGGNTGKLWIVDSASHILLDSQIVHGKISFLAQLPSSGSALRYYGTTNSLIFGNGVSAAMDDTSRPWMITAAQSSSADGNFVAAAQQGGTRLEIFSEDLQKCIFSGVLPVDSLTSLAAADIDGDGVCDIILTAGKKIIAVNQNGIILDHFPITLYDGSTFTGTPLIANIAGTTAPQLLATTSVGVLRVYQNDGAVLNGFPVQISSSGQNFPALIKTGNSKLGVLAVNSAGSVSAEEINTTYSAQNIFWSQTAKDAAHSNYAALPSSSQALSTVFFPKNRVYNWPNPVYGSATHIRYYVSENADISVRIFDAAGTSITELHGTGKAGFDNELLWDVSRIQTGIYFARVEAKSSARTENTIIKIAVVK
jgi:hypothetical protein